MITQKALVLGTHYSEQNSLLGSIPSPVTLDLAFPDPFRFGAHKAPPLAT